MLNEVVRETVSKISTPAHIETIVELVNGVTDEEVRITTRVELVRIDPIEVKLAAMRNPAAPSTLEHDVDAIEDSMDWRAMVHEALHTDDALAVGKVYIHIHICRREKHTLLVCEQ